ncbi:unnamed protein product [Eretmochelys imbricata]
MALGLSSSPSTPVRVYGWGGREHPGRHRRGAASPGNPQVLLLRHRGWGFHGSDQRHCSGSRGQRQVHHRTGLHAAQGASVSEVGPAAVGDRDLTELGSAPWDPGGAAALGPQGDLCWAAVPCLRPAPRAAPAPRHSHGGHHPAVSHPGPDLLGDTAVLPAATGWRQAARSPAGRQVAATGAGGGRGRGVGGGWAPGTGGQPELEGRLLPHGLRGGGRGAGAAGEVGCPAGRAGTGGVSLAEAGVSVKCRRLVEPGPLAGCCAGGERDRRQGEDTQDVTPSIWATVLAMVWLHGQAVGQCDESSCWRPRLWAGCGTEQGAQLSESLEAANALLGCIVGPAIFGL